MKKSVLFFCLLSAFAVNTVAQNLVELMPDTVASESDMVVKEIKTKLEAYHLSLGLKD